MEIKLAENYGFCFGVKRAIEIAEEAGSATTIGPLIHNNKEIDRLKMDFSVNTVHKIEDFDYNSKAIIRTHGIPKDDFNMLKDGNIDVVDATCPYVTKLQNIVEDMANEGYVVIIFGDETHPEVIAARSYAKVDPIVVLSKEELYAVPIHGKIAIVSQTTRKPAIFLDIVNYLIPKHKELRVFNTICNATFDNQDSARDLAQEADVMVVIGGKNSSNTKQLHYIAQEHCVDSYLVESKEELEKSWFEGKKLCGITAGASTPDWIIQKIINTIRNFKV